MDTKISTHCNEEKSFEDFYDTYTECKNYNSKRSLKPYMKIKITYQFSKL